MTHFITAVFFLLALAAPVAILCVTARDHWQAIVAALLGKVTVRRSGPVAVRARTTVRQWPMAGPLAGRRPAVLRQHAAA